MWILFSIVVVGCEPAQVHQNVIKISITADIQVKFVEIPYGSTVQEALNTAQVSLGELDKVNPALYTILTDGDDVRVIRVREEYYTQQVVIPFEHQELKNEAIPEGESRLSQAGMNGLQQTTSLKVFEDGIEVSDRVVKTETIQQAVPEILMVGSRSAFNSFGIPGKLAYLSAGNAWVIENATGNRRCVVATGKLDGRIFSLSRDGNLLLFTQLSSEDHVINSLWMATLNDNPAKIIDLGVKNIVHFAEFSPDSKSIAYSTAEWRETTPGWQANNDLYLVSIGPSGLIGSPSRLLEANSGGVYGWWGMDFSWAPDQARFLFNRPDEVGIFNRNTATSTTIIQINPYETNGDWAWVAGASWSADGSTIYTVSHEADDVSEMGGYTNFDLIAFPLNNDKQLTLVKNVGMFAYPVLSPIREKTGFINSDTGKNASENAFTVAYLQANSPEMSETSDYRLFVIDRDGSNRKGLFPEESAKGVEPQRVIWSPTIFQTDGNYGIAVIYNGNIWIVDAENGFARQITGDGLTSRIDWR
jgi:hypothetical protein